MIQFKQKSSQAKPAASRRLVRIVDDNVPLCESLRFFLEGLGYAVQVWNDPIAFLLEVRNCSDPGCILLDIRMPALSGLEVLERLQKMECSIPVIILTGHADVDVAVRALKHGAVDFLQKPPEQDALTESIADAVLKSEAEHTQQVRRLAALGQLEQLTGRELDVIRLVAQGRMNKQIADALGISEKTVQQHRGSACRKLGVRNAVEIAAFLAETGREP